MASVNKVILIGNLGADPELKYLPSGKAVCEVSIACNEVWTDRSGQKQERVEWIRCVVWDKTAENLAKYMRKGSQVYFEGSLRTESWDDKETGQKRYATKIQVRDVKFLGGGKSEGGGQRQERQYQERGRHPDQGSPAPPSGSEVEYPPSDDDIPF